MQSIKYIETELTVISTDTVTVELLINAGSLRDSQTVGTHIKPILIHTKPCLEHSTMHY